MGFWGLSEGDHVVAVRPIGVRFFFDDVPEGTKGKILAIKDGGWWSGPCYVVKFDNGAVVEASAEDIHQI